MKEPKKHPDFPEWIQTKNGKSCMEWPISEPMYLQNRLFWAFDAGRNCVWDQYIAQKNEIERLKEENNLLKKACSTALFGTNQERADRANYSRDLP